MYHCRCRLLCRASAFALLLLLVCSTSALRVHRSLVPLVNEFDDERNFERRGDARDFFDDKTVVFAPEFGTRDMECRRVHEFTDKCKFVRENCNDEEVGFFDYLELYYCRMGSVPAVPFIIMATWLGMLFTTIGIAASDFFCINLSTIANILGMSESLAGVTFLAFGNGSPDVFSTFAAMKINSGSLAIGELIGAASFIAAVVAGSMAIVRPFKVGRKSFVRDICFFILAVIFGICFLADGQIKMWECLVMILFYVFYVCFVVIWHWTSTSRKRRRRKERSAREHYTAPEEEDLLLDNEDDDDDEDGGVGGENQGLLGGHVHDFGALERGGQDETMDDEDEQEQQAYAELSSSMRISRPRMKRAKTPATPHNIRPSLVGALEFRSVLHSLEKTKNLQGPIHLRRYSDDPFLTLSSAYSTSNTVMSSTDGSFSQEGQNNRLNPHQPGVGRLRAVSVNDAAQATTNQDYFRNQHQQQLPDITLIRPSTPNLTRYDPFGDNYNEPFNRSATPEFLAPPSPNGRQGSPTNSEPVSPLSGPLPSLRVSDADSESMSQYHTFESPLPLFLNRPASPPMILLPPPSLEDSDSSDGLSDTTKPWERLRYWPYDILPPPQLLLGTLFPTLRSFGEKNLIEKILALIAMPPVLLLTITLPVVESPDKAKDPSGNDPPKAVLEPESPSSFRSSTSRSRPGTNGFDAAAHVGAEQTAPQSKDWNRWLVATQCVAAPLFMVITFFSDGPLLKPFLYASLCGLITLGCLLIFTSPNHPPRLRYLLCFAGFAVSISWISTVANEVVGVLKAFGVILGISDAILGLTIFAVGNSLGDLVADITVARLGFPVMALSACFGGPMLNILLGVGISGLYMTMSNPNHEPYQIEVSSTLIISAATLLLSLVALLIAVPANGWWMSRRIGWSLIALWVVSTILNLVVEVMGIGSQ